MVLIGQTPGSVTTGLVGAGLDHCVVIVARGCRVALWSTSRAGPVAGSPGGRRTTSAPVECNSPAWRRDTVQTLPGSLDRSAYLATNCPCHPLAALSLALGAEPYDDVARK